MGLGVALLANASPGASLLKVDFDQTGAPDDLQAGFSAFVFDGTASHTETYASSQATDGTIDVTIENATHYRDYNTITGGPFVGQSHLLRDYVLRNANGTMILTLGDLEAGTYEITLYHHSTEYGGGTFSVNLTDPLLTDDTKYYPRVSSGAAPTAVTSNTFTFASDGSDVVIDLVRTTGASSQHMALNGFALSTAPDTLKVDFDQSEVPNAVQGGFQAFEVVGDSPPTHANTYASTLATDGTIDVTIENATHYRDYNTINGGSFTNLSDLLSDMVLRNANGTMTMTLGDLQAGTYEITMFHHSSEFGGGGFSVNLTDSLVTAHPQYSATVSSGRSPTAVTSNTVTFVSDGSDVMIDLVGPSSAHMSLNGFELSPAPERLKVQFKRELTANDQAGWTTFAEPDGTPPVQGSITGGTYDGVSFTVTGTHVRSHPSGGGYLLVDHTDGGLDNLLSGGVLSNVNDTDVTLTLTGLAGGYYNITTYNHSPWTGNDQDETFDVRLTDSYVTDSPVHNDVAASSESPVTSATLACLDTSFSVVDGDAVTFVFERDVGFQSDSDHLNFNGFELYQVPDTDAPAVDNFTPADDSTVPTPATVSVTFNENIITNTTGNITITNITAGTSDVIPVGSGQLVVNGAQLTITPSAGLANNSDYAVLIDTNAIKDITGNFFAGITDTNTWSFATVEPIPNLIIRYTFDGDAGSTAVDSGLADGQQNLTIAGASAFTTDAQRGAVLNNAQGATLSFTSTSNNYTFMGWYKGTDTGYWYDQTDRFIPSVEANTSQDLSDGGAPNGLGIYEGAWHNSAVTSASDGNWHHITWVFQADGLGIGNDSFSIYVDGKAQDVDPATGGVQTKRQLSNGIKNLGGTQRLFSKYSTPTDTPLVGLVDEVRIYDRALGAAEVAELGDELAPTVNTLLPADDDVVVTPATLTVTFSEDILTNTTGNITITNLTAGTSDVVPVGSAQLVVSGAQLTITPSAPLATGDDYAVWIDTNAIRDIGGNFFAGITDTTTWNFTTHAPDSTAPTLQATSPVDEALDVMADANLVATFDEPVGAGSGNIVISNLTDSTATTIAVTDSSQVTVNGSALTVNPSSDLLYAKDYAVLIDAGAIEDLLHNDFAGIADTTTWNFSTVAQPVQVQFKQSAGANDQAGWTTVVDDTPPVPGSITGGAFDGMTFTANGTHVRSHTHHADYRLVDHTDGDYDNLLSGGLLSNDDTADITLALSGLADGEYLIRTYHHTPYSRTDGLDFDLRLTDALVTDSLIYDDVAISYGGTVDTATLVSLITPCVVSNGNTVTLAFDPEALGMVSLGGDHLNLNGFEVFMRADTNAPTIDTLVPADDATVATPAALVAIFDEDIATNTTGNITITNITAGTSDVIPVGSAQLVTSGAQLTITPSAALANGTDYAVLIDTNAITDLAGNFFAGITDTSGWNFSTTSPDVTAPTIQTYAPIDDATDVLVWGNLVATFDELIVVGSGNIVLTNLTDNTATNIAVTDVTQVTVSGTTLTIDPAGRLDGSDAYAVLMDAGVVEDLAANDFAGISDTTTWNFTTEAVDDNLIIHYTFDGDAGSTAVDSGIADGQQNLTINGASAFVTDGVRGDVLSNAQGASLSFTSASQDYTFAGWFKGTDNGYWYDQTDRFVMSVERNTANDPNDGGAAAGLGLYEDEWHNNGVTAANDGNWHHIAWVVETDGLGAGNDSLSIYLDGVATDVDPATGGVQTKRLLTNGIKDLGGTQHLFSNQGSPTTDQLVGLFDDVRIYDRALAAAEVAVLGDTNAPTAAAFLPEDDSTVATPDWVRVTFDEDIKTNTTGNITLTNITAGTAHVITVGSTQFVISGAQLTITPSAPLANSSDYAVLIDTNAITDVGGNFFAGITNTTTWNFTTTTPDLTAPAIQSLAPADDTTTVPIETNLVARFDEAVVVGSGNIVITNLTDGTATNIAVTDVTQVTVSGTTLTINASSDLLGPKTYAVLIDAGAVEDLAGNDFAGISSTGTWNFTTEVVIPNLIIHYTFDGDTGSTAIDYGITDGEQNMTIAGTFVSDAVRGAVLEATGGGSLSFASTSQYYTFAGWYKGSDRGYWYDQTDRFVLSIEENTQNDPSDGGVTAGLGAYDNAWHNSVVTSANDGDWHHIVWVFEADGLGAGNDSLSIYLDGAAQDVDPATGGVQAKRQLANGIKDLGGAQQKLFSSYNGGAVLLGRMDDVRIYDRVLGAGEVATLYSETSSDVIILNVVNPSFEIGTAPFAGAPGWTMGDVGGNDYYTTTGTGLSTSDPNNGQEGAGTQFLTGNRLALEPDDPSNPGASLATQSISVHDFWSDIDAGTAVLGLDFYYNRNENPAPSVAVEFFDAGGGSLGSLTTGALGSTAANAWVSVYLTGAVPVNARRLEIQLNSSRSAGTATNVSYDNFTAALSGVTVPHPTLFIVR